MSGSNLIQGIQQASVSNGANPNVGQVYSFYLPLAAGNPVTLDLKTLVNLHRIGDVQGIMVDNSAGTASLQITTTAGENLLIPAASQALMPLYLSADKTITFEGAVASPGARIVLLNFPTPACVWGSAGTGGSPGAPTYTKEAPYTSAGPSQNLPLTTSAQSLTVPSGATSAVISVTGGNVMWRDDGTAPTATVGQEWNVGTNTYAGPLSAIEFILATGTSAANLFISYYK